MVKILNTDTYDYTYFGTEVVQELLASGNRDVT
jgi:hypothetical protein